MHPILLELGPLTLHTYGLFIALAFLGAMGAGSLCAKNRGLDYRLTPDVSFWILVGAIAGSRLLFVILNISYFVAHPLEIFMFWKGGLVFQGGLILAVGLAIYYLKKHGQSVAAWADALAPALALGQSIGRLGCFFAGCCYGRACELPWAVTFTDPASLAPKGVALHPTQLYHSGAMFSIFLVLMFFSKRLVKPGSLMGLYLVLYAPARFVIEFFRNDYRGAVGPISATQFIASAIFILGLWLVLRKPARNARDRSG